MPKVERVRDLTDVDDGSLAEQRVEERERHAEASERKGDRLWGAARRNEGESGNHGKERVWQREGGRRCKVEADAEQADIEDVEKDEEWCPREPLEWLRILHVEEYGAARELPQAGRHHVKGEVEEQHREWPACAKGDKGESTEDEEWAV